MNLARRSLSFILSARASSLIVVPPSVEATCHRVTMNGKRWPTPKSAYYESSVEENPGRIKFGIPKLQSSRSQFLFRQHCPLGRQVELRSGKHGLRTTGCTSTLTSTVYREIRILYSVTRRCLPACAAIDSSGAPPQSAQTTNLCRLCLSDKGSREEQRIEHKT